MSSSLTVYHQEATRGERVSMVVETWPAEDVAPEVCSLHPALVHVVRLQQGRRAGHLETVPANCHWYQIFVVEDGLVWHVSNTSELDVDTEGAPRGVPERNVVTKVAPVALSS